MRCVQTNGTIQSTHGIGRSVTCAMQPHYYHSRIERLSPVCYFPSYAWHVGAAFWGWICFVSVQRPTKYVHRVHVVFAATLNSCRTQMTTSDATLIAFDKHRRKMNENVVATAMADGRCHLSQWKTRTADSMTQNRCDCLFCFFSRSAHRWSYICTSWNRVLEAVQMP